MTPFCNPLAQRIRAEIRAQERRRLRLAMAFDSVAAVLVLAVLPVAYTVGIATGEWLSR